ncbi:hypothetical protein L1887_05032 [Cichorium endivia]|nr:hypothetical protein L1887_05032 [Cichorium endivia]
MPLHSPFSQYPAIDDKGYVNDSLLKTPVTNAKDIKVGGHKEKNKQQSGNDKEIQLLRLYKRMPFTQKISNTFLFLIGFTDLTWKS